MPLQTVPKPKLGEGGHVVANDTREVRTIVMSTTPDENIVNVSKNMQTIAKVAGSLSSIISVDGFKNSITDILAIKQELQKVAGANDTIVELSAITDELEILANNINTLTATVQNIDTVKTVGENIDEIHFLYEIRNHIVALNTAKDRVLNVLDNIANIDINAKGIADIKLVALHMLAVEIVAQNIDLLKFFNNHTELFEKTVEMYPALQEFLKYVDIAQELVDIVTNLPETLEQFKGDMNNLANEMTEKFKALADDRLEQMERAYDKFMSESLRLRESILDVDKALTDFKLKSMEEYTVLREGIARFKEDLAKSQEQIQGDINEVEKNILTKVNQLELDFNTSLDNNEKNTTEKISNLKEDLVKAKNDLESSITTHEKEAFKRISHIELNLSNAIEVVKKDNAEFKLEVTKQLKNSSNENMTALRELENVVNSFKNTTEVFKANTTNTLTTIQEDIRQLKSRPTTAVQENTWEII